MTRASILRGGGWLLCGVLLLAPVVIVRAQEPANSSGQTGARESYVGSKACKACHAETAEAWVASRHGQALSQEALPPEIKGCEACHGPASAHIGSAGQQKPHVPSRDNSADTNELCGSCHFKSTQSRAPNEWQNLSAAFFARSMHGRRGMSCLSCHAGHAGESEAALVKPADELCLDCHASVLDSSPGKKASYTHSPVAGGQCQMCHDPHGTSARGMVVENIQQVCQTCHDAEDPNLAAAHQNYSIAGSNCAGCHDPHSHDNKAKLVRKTQHAPFKQGKCELCHTPPSQSQSIGLVKPAKELCFSCHPASRLTPEGEHAHPPVKAGLCSTCHDAHASNDKALTKSRAADACFTCHSKIESDTVEAHRHKVLEGNLNCQMCHKPHSSKEEHLLAKDEMTLCGQCHRHSFSHPMAAKGDGSSVTDPSTGKPLVCSGCHEVHGSQFEAMTKADKNRELCVLCHKSLES